MSEIRWRTNISLNVYAVSQYLSNVHFSGNSLSVCSLSRKLTAIQTNMLTWSRVRSLNQPRLFSSDNFPMLLLFWRAAGASTERCVCEKSWRPFPPQHSVTRQLGSYLDSEACFALEAHTVTAVRPFGSE